MVNSDTLADTATNVLRQGHGLAEAYRNGTLFTDPAYGGHYCPVMDYMRNVAALGETTCVDRKDGDSTSSSDESDDEKVGPAEQGGEAGNMDTAEPDVEATPRAGAGATLVDSVVTNTLDIPKAVVEETPVDLGEEDPEVRATITEVAGAILNFQPSEDDRQSRDYERTVGPDSNARARVAPTREALAVAMPNLAAEGTAPVVGKPASSPAPR